MKSKGRFTQKAEQAIENAGKAASELGHSYVGTEHLLLGILADRDSLGARILEKRGINRSVLRRLTLFLRAEHEPAGQDRHGEGRR